MVTPTGNIKESNTQLRKYIIENDKGTRLIVSNIGAAVMSLFVKDKNGDFADIVLGYDDPNDYLADDYYFGTVIGRYANRIAGGKVKIEGEEFEISTKDGVYHHHGGNIGFNKKIFDAETFEEDGKSGIIFKYTSPHLEEGFPGQLQLRVIYTLDNDNIWTVEYKAVSDRTTLINLTQHTYFNLTGNPANSIDEHELKISSNYYLPVNHLQVPTGEFEDVSDTPFDFRTFKKIGKAIGTEGEQLRISNGYDHSFVLEKQHTTLLKHVAVARDPQSGRKLELYTTEPSVHFYSGNFLRDVPGKEQQIYNKRSGFCLETQHLPDAPNHAHFPSTILQAGEEFYSKTMFIFSVG